MKDKFKKINLKLFSFVFVIYLTLIIIQPRTVSASENVDSLFIQKVSKSYTKKFCNSIGFGLSKESAMNFSLKENNQVFNKRKEFRTINKEILADRIATTVVEKCGYPINLLGERGVLEFKNYYLSKDQESQIKTKN